MSTITLTVFLINGDFEVHTAGCRDIARTVKSGRVGNRFNIKVGDAGLDPTEYAVIADLWSDIISENVPETYSTEAKAVASYADNTKFYDCVKVLEPLGKPKAKTGQKLGTGPKAAVSQPMGSGNRETPKPSVKQAAKRDLATAVVMAAAAVAKDPGAYGLDLADISQDEAAKMVAQWLHHLPVNRDNWPAALPKPDRSDWR